MWLSVLLVEEPWVPGTKPTAAASHSQTLSHIVVSSTPSLRGIRTYNVSGCTDCICRYKSNNHKSQNTDLKQQIPHPLTTHYYKVTNHLINWTDIWLSIYLHAWTIHSSFMLLAFDNEQWRIACIAHHCTIVDDTTAQVRQKNEFMK